MSAPRAHFLSRLAFDTVLLDLPNADEGELPSMIRFGLAAHYPGSLETAAIGWSAVRSASGYRVIAYLLAKDSLDHLNGKFGNIPILPALPLVLAWKRTHPVLSAAMETAVIVQDDCVETVRFHDGIPIESRVVGREERRTDPGSDIGSLLDAATSGEDRSGRICLFAPPDDRSSFDGNPDRTASSDEKSPDGNGYCLAAESKPEVVRVSFDSLSPKHVRRSEYLYAPASRGFRVPYPVRIAVLSALLAGLGVFTAMGTLLREEAEFVSLKAAFAAFEREYRSTAGEATERTRLSAILEELSEKRPLDTYAFFSLLALTLPSDVQITSLTLSGAAFELEGTAPAPFALVSRFNEKKEFFSNVGISRVVPLSGGSRFFLTGTFHGR